MGVVLMPDEKLVKAKEHVCRTPRKDGWSIIPAHPKGTIWKCDTCGLHWRVETSEGRLTWRKLNKRQNRILDRRAKKELAHQGE